jgi:hypothetical protein
MPPAAVLNFNRIGGIAASGNHAPDPVEKV